MPETILDTVLLIECKHSASEDDLIEDANAGVKQIIDQKYLEEKRFKKYAGAVGYGISFYKNNVMWLNVNKIFLKRYIVGLWSHFFSMYFSYDSMQI